MEIPESLRDVDVTAHATTRGKNDRAKARKRGTGKGSHDWREARETFPIQPRALF
jgi:hypothetical protein